MFECDGKEPDGKELEFMAALHSYLVRHDKAYYQPRIQTKPVSVYRLWKMVWEAGGQEAVRPFCEMNFFESIEGCSHRWATTNRPNDSSYFLDLHVVLGSG